MTPQTKAMNMPFWHTLVVKAARTFPKSCFFPALQHSIVAKQRFPKTVMITMRIEQVKCMAGCLSQSLQKVRHAENQCQCKLPSILVLHRSGASIHSLVECLAVSEGAREMLSHIVI